MKGLLFNFNKDCIYSSRSEIDFGPWYSEYDNSLLDIELTEKYPDAVCSLDIKSGDKVFALWLEYSQGDSFGNGYKCQTEAIGVFLDNKIASELEKFINETDKNEIQYMKSDQAMNDFISKLSNKNQITFNKNEDGYYQIIFTTSDKQEFKFSYFPWVGYFELLENIYITDTVIK